MKKLAVFVEGLTEQIFVNKLLVEIAGAKNIYIEQKKAKTNNKGNRSFAVISASSAISSQKYYVLICDSGGDSCVKSDILDSLESLTRENYEKILGLKDVFPHNFSDIPKLERGLKYGMPTKYIPVNITLAIMEVEAWFLGEASHFLQIHPLLTNERIKAKIKFDPTVENVETRLNPAKDLDDIYHLEGLAYNKKKSNIQRTVNALNYASIYCVVKNRVAKLSNFIDEIDSFLS